MPTKDFYADGRIERTSRFPVDLALRVRFNPQAAKLSNQVALAASMVGMPDALSLAQQEGLDLEQTREMILAGTGASGAMDSLAPKALVGDWKPGFMVQHFIKDLGLALQEAEEREIEQSGGKPALELQLVPFLKKGESVLEALQRLGAVAKKKG